MAFHKDPYLRETELYFVADKLDKLRTSPEALFGFSHSLAALIGSVKICPLGMPHSRSKQVGSILYLQFNNL